MQKRQFLDWRDADRAGCLVFAKHWKMLERAGYQRLLFDPRLAGAGCERHDRRL